MKIFVESLDKGIWDAIENDPSFLVNLLGVLCAKV